MILQSVRWMDLTFFDFQLAIKGDCLLAFFISSTSTLGVKRFEGECALANVSVTTYKCYQHLTAI